VTTTAPPTTSSVPTTAVTTNYPAGASVVSTGCPAEVVPQTSADTGGQDAETAQDIVVHEYPVHGATADELRAQLRQCGPTSEGTTYDGLTKWYISWRFGFDSSNGCRIAWSKVHVLVDVYLPKWDEAPGSTLEPEWNRYVTALRDHEMGHVQHGLDGANQAASAISNVAPAPTCGDLEASANQAGHAVLDTFRHEDQAYDDETDHGATQGARFP
jgi:predicted secreted Zn-dependent protease